MDSLPLVMALEKKHALCCASLLALFGLAFWLLCLIHLLLCSYLKGSFSCRWQILFLWPVYCLVCLHYCYRCLPFHCVHQVISIIFVLFVQARICFSFGSAKWQFCCPNFCSNILKMFFHKSYTLICW